MNLCVDWLDFEAGGRQVNPSRRAPPSSKTQGTTPVPAHVSRARARALEFVRSRVKSMLRAAAGFPLAELARGRGKLRDAWTVVEALHAEAESLRTLEGRAYRTSEVLTGGLPPVPCSAEAVDGARRPP